MACNFFQKMAVEQMLVCMVMILVWTNAVAFIDPISITVGAGSAIYGTFKEMYCRYKECCDSTGIPFNFTSKSSSHSGSNCNRYITHTMNMLIYL
jgi:hypothetical protein